MCSTSNAPCMYVLCTSRGYTAPARPASNVIEGVSAPSPTKDMLRCQIRAKRVHYLGTKFKLLTIVVGFPCSPLSPLKL